jgi:hypothetical protein
MMDKMNLESMIQKSLESMMDKNSLGSMKDKNSMMVMEKVITRLDQTMKGLSNPMNSIQLYMGLEPNKKKTIKEMKSIKLTLLV